MVRDDERSDSPTGACSRSTCRARAGGQLPEHPLLRAPAPAPPAGRRPAQGRLHPEQHEQVRRRDAPAGRDPERGARRAPEGLHLPGPPVRERRAARTSAGSVPIWSPTRRSSSRTRSSRPTSWACRSGTRTRCSPPLRPTSSRSLAPYVGEPASALPRPRLPDVGHPAALRARQDAHRGADVARPGPGQPRRMFAAGGSDAHGDWNYRREGYFFGTAEVDSTAMGTPRNLVYVGEPQGSTIAERDRHRPAALAGPGRRRAAQRKLRHHGRSGRARRRGRERQRQHRSGRRAHGRCALPREQRPVPGDRRVEVVG